MFAVFHAANFALQAVLRNEPFLNDGRAAALFDDTRNKSLVLEINSSARAVGIELHMSAPQAVARCPALIIRTPCPAAELEARATLHAVGFTLSPSLEDTAPGICTIDLRGANPTRLTATAGAAIAQLQAFGLIVTIGIDRKSVV